MVNQQEIPYELAPFGKFPYGREMFGYLGYENSSACQPFELQRTEQDEDYSQMLIVEEGDCNIKQKTLNAEHGGAKLLIIIRQNNQSHQELSSATKDLVNFNVEIPAITVERKVGNKLKNMINTQGKVLIKFQMPIPQSEIVYVDVMMKQDELKMYDFLTSIKNHIFQFEDKLQLAINFLPDQQTTNENKAELQIRINCINYEYIFDLLQIYKDECIKKNQFEYNCFQTLTNGLDPEIILHYKACVQENLYKKKEIKKNLESNLQGNKSHILINGNTFHGYVNPENVFEAICGAYASSPKSCLFLNNKYSVFMKYNQYKRNAGKHKFLIHFITLSLTLFLLTMAGIAIHLAYEKVYKRFLNQNVQRIVHESMSNYQSIKNNE